MINKKTGELIIGKTAVGPKFTKTEFINSNLYSDLWRIGFANPNDMFSLLAQRIGESLFFVEINFRKTGFLDLLRLSITPDGKLKDWKDWSKEGEMEIKRQHDKLLEMDLGQPPYIFMWGRVSSVYDQKAGSSCINIRYS